jgi:hypothetical protein
MNSKLNKLPAPALRALIIHEIRKFATALEYGSTLSDLEEIRDYIIELEGLLKVKEENEMQLVNTEDLTHVDLKTNGYR